MYQQILPRLASAAPDAVILVLTDPPDPLADVVRTFGFAHVLSSGTLLDSLRFRFHLARHLNVDAASVEANVLGEHGTSETFVWSSASISGVPVLDALKLSGESRETFCRQIEHDVRFANIEIIEGNQASQFGIGMVAARIAQAVLRDERISRSDRVLQRRLWRHVLDAERAGADRGRADPRTIDVRGRATRAAVQRGQTAKCVGKPPAEHARMTS